MGQLDGKVAIITGSSKGIGAAVAHAFADEGASLVLNSRSALDGTVADPGPGSVVHVQGAIGDAGVVDALVASARREFGRLDIVVNNAAHIEPAAGPELAGFTDDIWQRTLHTNVVAPYQLVAAAERDLRANGDGCVINTTSVLATRTFSPLIPYNVSKAALAHLTRLLAVQLGPEIRVNAVAPGFVETAGTTSPENDRAAPIRQAVTERAPLRRCGTPEDIAATVLALVLSPYTTGQVVYADGGLQLVM